MPDGSVLGETGRHEHRSDVVSVPGRGSARVTALLAGQLVVLALIDSTSFGTLVVPLWLMLTTGHFRASRLLAYLAAVASFYLVLGIALSAGAHVLASQVGAVLDSRPAHVAQLVVAVGLMVLGLTVEPLTAQGKRRRAERREAKERRDGPGRLVRWRMRAMSGEEGLGGLVALALSAAALEAASMLPYLAAIGLLSASGLSLAARGGVLLGYCLVMVAPALVLLAVRLVFRERIVVLLQRVEQWMTKHSREGLAWVLFLLGLYLAGGALRALGL